MVELLERIFKSFWYGVFVGLGLGYWAFCFIYKHSLIMAPTVEAEPSAICYLIGGLDRDGELRCKSENGFEYTLVFLKRTKK